MSTGISGKSQVLFGMVFITRYLDLATNFVSVYNTSMKIVFIAAILATCYLIFFKFRATYDANHDAFRAEFLVIPTAGLAVLVNHEFSLLEVWSAVDVCVCVCYYVYHLSQILWTFSIYLESVAIMPQLYMISKTGEAETITSHYLFALGLYRGLYIANWIFRYYTEEFYDLIAIVAGCVQTALYCDFFYLYITKGIMLLPIILVSEVQCMNQLASPPSLSPSQ